MNFAPLNLDDDLQKFWYDVRAFFDAHVTDEVRDEERRTGGGFNESLHLRMGERGWVAPQWPVSEGGADLDDLRARIVAIEFERSGAPAILAMTTLLPALAVRMFGTEDIRDEVLPGIADGSIRVCLGYTEPDTGSDLAAVRTRAVRDGADWLISGQKMFTTGAQFCQYCFCLTRTNNDVRKHKGLTVFLVPMELPGVEIRGIDTLGGERTNFVHFDDVRVPDRYRVGDVDGGWRTVSVPLAAEHGKGEEAGVAGTSYTAVLRRLHDAVINWARTTFAEDGRPRIADPQVRELLARVAVDIEIAEVSPGPMGRIFASEALIARASDLLDVVGPTALLGHGATGAVADGLLEYGYRFAPGTAIYGGTTEIHRNMIAEQTLGLPRSTPAR